MQPICAKKQNLQVRGINLEHMCMPQNKPLNDFIYETENGFH